MMNLIIVLIFLLPKIILDNYSLLIIGYEIERHVFIFIRVLAVFPAKA